MRQDGVLGRRCAVIDLYRIGLSFQRFEHVFVGGVISHTQDEIGIHFPDDLQRCCPLVETGDTGLDDLIAIYDLQGRILCQL